MPRAAREWIVSYYSRYHGEAQAHGLVRAATPFRFAGAAPDFGALDADAAMQVLRRQLDALGARLPMLYKQYVDVCEPGGVEFLAFGVDPGFGDSVDGLIRLDLTRVRPARRQRYLASRHATSAIRARAAAARVGDSEA